MASFSPLDSVYMTSAPLPERSTWHCKVPFSEEYKRLVREAAPPPPPPPKTCDKCGGRSRIIARLCFREGMVGRWLHIVSTLLASLVTS